MIYLKFDKKQLDFDPSFERAKLEIGKTIKEALDVDLSLKLKEAAHKYYCNGPSGSWDNSLLQRAWISAIIGYLIQSGMDIELSFEIDDRTSTPTSNNNDHKPPSGIVP